MFHRSGAFRRRSVLYTGLDAQLRDHTRFFAAAALINAVLAKVHSPALPSPRSLRFLDEVGAELETYNLICAREIGRRSPGSALLDHTLVCREQGRLQRHVLAYQAQRPEHWLTIRAELNRLLNDRSAAAFFARWCGDAERVSRALREVRGHLGTELDFAAESHRVRIGLQLIAHIRRDSQPARGGSASLAP